MKFQITVGGCSIGIVCNEETVENLMNAVRKAHPTQDVGYVIYEEFEDSQLEEMELIS